MKAISRIAVLICTVIILAAAIFNVSAVDVEEAEVSYVFFLDGGERDIYVDNETGLVTVIYNYIVLCNGEIAIVPMEVEASECGLISPGMATVIETQYSRQVIPGIVLTSEYDPESGIGDEIEITRGSTLWYDTDEKAYKVTVNEKDYVVGFDNDTQFFAESRNDLTNSYEGVRCYTAYNMPKLSDEFPNLESGIIKINRNSSGSIISYTLLVAHSLNGKELIYSPAQIDFRVTFDACGGNISQKYKNVKYGAAYGALPIPEKHGYEFNGWYIENNGEKVNITGTSVVSVKDDHVLYADWSKKPYTPYMYGFYIGKRSTETVVDPEDGSVMEYDNIFVFYEGKAITIPVADADALAENTVVTIKNKTDGIYEVDNGIVLCDEYNSESGEGCEIRIPDSTLWYDPLNKTYMVTSDNTDYTVILDEKSYMFAKKINAYGYYENVTAYSQSNMPKLSNAASNISDGIICINEDDMGKKTYTLFIAYCTDKDLLNVISDESVTMMVSFNAGLGYTPTLTKSVEFGSIYGDLPIPERAEYTFVGWYTENGTRIDSTSMVRLNHSHPLYAKWEQEVIVYGDINGDNSTNVSDVIIILRSIAAGTVNDFDANIKKAADVNGDGSIDVTDAIKILRHIASPDIPLAPNV
ncbi:MAG: InlB B-repeat-containing protein [Clostridia bacterium]|nr:InlB B-repeat-containing protein [Clostridia bacterium]